MKYEDRFTRSGPGSLVAVMRTGPIGSIRYRMEWEGAKGKETSVRFYRGICLDEDDPLDLGPNEKELANAGKLPKKVRDWFLTVSYQEMCWQRR